MTRIFVLGVHFCILIVESDASVYGDEYELGTIFVFFCMNFLSVNVYL